jgi:translocation and assembly module TamB
LYSEDQQIAADGRLDPKGEQTLIVDIDNFRVESIADLAGVDGLGGTLNGDISFSGPAAAPKLDGTLVMKVESNNKDVGDLRVNVGYDSLRLNIDAKLTHIDDTELTARGYLPVDLRLRAPTPIDITAEPVDFDIETERLPIDWIDPFLDPQLVREPSGRLQADIQIDGTIGTPEVGGTAKLRDGGLRVYDLDVSYERATADVSFDGERIVLSNTQVYDQSGGRLTASGFINLAELTVGEYDLDLNAREFVAIDTRAYRDVRIDGDLAVTGTTDEPVVRGNLTVIQGDIFYSETLSEAEAASLATVQLNEQDRRLLEQRFSVRLTEADTTTFDAYQAMEMEMSVNIRRDTWLRSRANPELNIQFTGTLDLEKASGEDARVFGAIDVVPERSTVRQFGQEFRIQEGTLSFNGNPEEPYLNFIAVYEKQSRQTNSTEVEITLSAQGRPEDLDLQLSSQPQMDTRNILSYLATGQPADQLLSGGGSTTDLAENLAIGQLTSLAENFATSNVGLDVVRIQYQPDGGSYFVLGRYVTPRFYVAIEQPVAVNQNQQGGSATSTLAPDLTLEYELTDNLLMRAQSRQQSLRFNLLFEYAY